MLFAHPGINHLAFQSLYCCVGEHYFPVTGGGAAPEDTTVPDSYGLELLRETICG